MILLIDNTKNLEQAKMTPKIIVSWFVAQFTQ